MAASADQPSADDQFAARIQAEIMAAAEQRRREDPRLARAEREIERAWAEVAPPGAVGTTEELLLDRVDRLAMVDVDAPIGSKPGIRQVKGAIRKGTYWYLRYMSDQLNAFHNVQARLLRRLDQRIAALEAVAGLDRAVDGLVRPAPRPGRACGAAVAAALPDGGRVLVVAAGQGDALAGLAGVSAYGVESDAASALVGIDAGVDLRVDDPIDHLRSLEAGSLAGVLLGGAPLRCGPAAARALVETAAATCAPGGVVAVAVEDRSRWTEADRELLAGRGLAPDTWAVLLGPAAASVDIVPVDDDGIDRLVVARRP